MHDALGKISFVYTIVIFMELSQDPRLNCFHL